MQPAVVVYEIGPSASRKRWKIAQRKRGLEPENTCGKAKEIPQGIGQDRARRGRFCPSEGHGALVGGLGHARTIEEPSRNP